MSDAAQGEPIKHQVFTTPFKVVPQYEMWKTPPNYRRYPGGSELPAELKVWRVQNSGKSYGSVVSSPDAFDSFPDAEVLTPGFNTGKQNGAVGVGRHGNYLQWGFSSAPSQMTEPGRCFLLNCICYIRKFDGKAPLVYHQSSPRGNAATIAGFIKIVNDPNYGRTSFPAGIFAKYRNDPDALAKLYQDNIELVYYDRGYIIDDELRSLGLDSNRKPQTLEKLISLRDDPQKASLAEKLLKRYTNESFQNARQWQGWLAANRGRIFFSDVGGYKFLVVPAGYLEMANTKESP